MVKKYLVTTLVCLGVGQMLFAEEEFENCCYPSVVIGEPLDPCCGTPVYPYPATISPCNSWNIYAEGEFIYFSLSRDVFPAPAANLAFDNSEWVFLPRNTPYRPGFRVAIGIDLGSVVLNVRYLRYHPHITTRFSAKNNGGVTFIDPSPSVASALFGGPRGFFQTVNSTFDFGLDIVTVSLQKPVYMGKRIIMNLNYGIMGVWIDEKGRYTATALTNPIPPGVGATSNGTSMFHDKFWAVGPNLGFSFTGLLPCHFQLLADLDLSLQYSEHYKADSSSSFPNYPSPQGNTSFTERGHGDFYQVWQSGEIGIGWGDYLFCNRYHLNLSIKYSWNLQHIFVNNTPLTPFGTDFNWGHNFSMHGIAVGGRLDF